MFHVQTPSNISSLQHPQQHQPPQWQTLPLKLMPLQQRQLMFHFHGHQRLLLRAMTPLQRTPTCKLLERVHHVLLVIIPSLC
jgi:hypothetical protein